MDNTDHREPSQPPAEQPGASPAHFLYVGMLLVIIIALLAILWTRERRDRMAAEQKVVNLRHNVQMLRNKNDALQKALGTIGALQMPTTRPDE